MNYTYEGSGGISIAGCAEHRKTLFLIFKYAPGSDLYICYKAAKGVLEKIKIKKIIVGRGYRTRLIGTPLYQDTLNALFNEWDLCTESEAIALATAYYDKQLMLANELINNCTIS